MERKETQLSPATTRKTYRHGNLRESALAEARRRLADNDTIGSLRSLAGALGVNHAALYRHFSDKDALLTALAADGFAELATDLQKASGVTGIVGSYIAFALRENGLYDIMMSRQNRTFAPGEDLHKSLQLVLSAIRSALGEHVIDLDIKRLWVLTHGAISLHGSGALLARDDESLMSFVITMLDLPPAS